MVLWVSTTIRSDQLGEQDFVKAGQSLWSVPDGINRQANCIDLLINILIAKQLSPLPS